LKDWAGLPLRVVCVAWAVLEDLDGPGSKEISAWGGVCALSAAALPAFAVEATLVADAHVNSARPAVNSGAISNLNVGGGYTALMQFDL
jgi:hypothetical protein